MRPCQAPSGPSLAVTIQLSQVISRLHHRDVGINCKLSVFFVPLTLGSIYLLDPMHPCLRVDEIVRLVAHELVTSDEEVTTLALARCCKTLEELVLDVLWETQEKLLPLLKTLPGDIWDEGGYAVSVSMVEIFSSLNRSIRKSFRRPPTTLEWSRFRKHARRMRELEERGDLEVISPVFPVLQFLRHRRTHFPTSENPPVVVRRCRGYPGHPLAPFPQHHRHRHLTLWTRSPQTDGSFDGRHLPDAVSQLAGNQP